MVLIRVSLKSFITAMYYISLDNIYLLIIYGWVDKNKEDLLRNSYLSED